MLLNNKIPNRLINEKSPYLLQHAYNPVDWYPWCDEAFQRAKSENKPIFLSIGYSSCHWCHVMEKKVFEVEEAAQLLNEYFISIKVDREERPDIDHVYMEASQVLTGGGGWPLSIFMTPDKKPFFAGTYFALSQFEAILVNINKMWTENRSKVQGASDEIAEYIQKDVDIDNQVKLDEEVAHKAYHQLRSSFDSVNGGFGGAPKFPSPHTLMYLKRYALLYHKEDAKKMVDVTLKQMFKGGLFDHIGGGFCRYSTDHKYLVPHFEKMLYDNAMLVITYAESGMFDIVSRTLEFCLQELLSPEGGFYTAYDADSEGVEGKYYLFTQDEIKKILGNEDAKRFCQLYDITKDGNFEGSNIPNLLNSGILQGEDEIFAEQCREKIRIKRNERIAPARDEKILLSSNSLMIAALATAGQKMKQEKYIEAAISAAKFIQSNMAQDGRLYAAYRGERLPHLATSDDYAYFAWGLYRLHQATLDDFWLKSCKQVCDDMLDLFADDNGLLWMSGNDVTDLPIRSKNTDDGALPSGNSIAAGIFLRLYILLADEKYNMAYQNIMNAMTNQVESYPTAYTSLLSAYLLELQGGVKVELPNKNKEMKHVMEAFHPFTSYRENEEQESAIVCKQGACLPPVETMEKLVSLIE